MFDLAPISDKPGSLIRLLSSDRDGEIVAAARALIRTLRSAGCDIHDLAAHIEHANGGGLTDAEMRKLYDAGYEAGMRAVEDKHYGTSDFHNVDGMPSWHEIARWCQRRGDRLHSREQQFINDMAARTMWRERTEKQEEWLKSIFCGSEGS